MSHFRREPVVRVLGDLSDSELSSRQRLDVVVEGVLPEEDPGLSGIRTLDAVRRRHHRPTVDQRSAAPATIACRHCKLQELLAFDSRPHLEVPIRMRACQGNLPNPAPDPPTTLLREMTGFPQTGSLTTGPYWMSGRSSSRSGSSELDILGKKCHDTLRACACDSGMSTQHT